MMSEQQCVLVTGGSGLVGRAVAEEVQSNDGIWNKYNFVFLSSKDADLRDFHQTELIFNTLRPSYVINLAARVGGLYANMADSDSFYNDNIKINRNVLHLSSEFRVKKCISCLSTCIFPAEIDYPLEETKIHLGPPHNSNAGYSMAKREVDLMNREMNSKDGSSLFTAVIPTNVYGRNDNFCPEQSHVIPSLIYKAFQSVIEGNPTLVVCGSGKPLRQFIYSLDLAKLLLWTLENYEDTEPLILCPDESDEVSISQVASMITTAFEQNLKLKMKILHDANLSDGQYKKTASNRKLRSLYPDFQFTPLESGIQEVVSWYISNYPNIRIG